MNKSLNRQHFREVDIKWKAMQLTEVHDIVACSIESSGIELQSDDSKYDDSKEKKKGDVDQWTNCFCY